jgi:uncharacterized membrane protein (UPF0127 family)
MRIAEPSKPRPRTTPPGLKRHALTFFRRHQDEDWAREKRSSLKKAVLIGPRGQVVCERCYVADRSLPRVRGLIGWKQLAGTEGMLLRPSWSMHTAFVRFPVDVVFLDDELTVLAIAHRLRPWHIAVERGAHSVLELAAGRCEQLGVSPGDSFAWGWL